MFSLFQWYVHEISAWYLLEYTLRNKPLRKFWNNIPQFFLRLRLLPGELEAFQGFGKRYLMAVCASQFLVPLHQIHFSFFKCNFSRVCISYQYIYNKLSSNWSQKNWKFSMECSERLYSGLLRIRSAHFGNYMTELQIFRLLLFQVVQICCNLQDYNSLNRQPRPFCVYFGQNE